MNVCESYMYMYMTLSICSKPLKFHTCCLRVLQKLTEELSQKQALYATLRPDSERLLKDKSTSNAEGIRARMSSVSVAVTRHHI